MIYLIFFDTNIQWNDKSYNTFLYCVRNWPSFVTDITMGKCQAKNSNICPCELFKVNIGCHLLLSFQKGQRKYLQCFKWEQKYFVWCFFNVLQTLSKHILCDHKEIFLVECIFPWNKLKLKYIKGNSCRKSL